MQVNPSELSESERSERQIKRLPATLSEAIQSWEAAQDAKVGGRHPEGRIGALVRPANAAVCHEYACGYA
jgi:hypothetical protein